MFENIGTAIVQALGFFGVFAFFVYQLLSDKAPITQKNEVQKTKIDPKPKKTGLFGRQKKVNTPSISDIKKEKKGWFNR